MKTRKPQIDKLNEELAEVLHPPYVQLKVTKSNKPKYQVHNHYGGYVTGAQTVDTLRMYLNLFLGVEG